MTAYILFCTLTLTAISTACCLELPVVFGCEAQCVSLNARHHADVTHSRMIVCRSPHVLTSRSDLAAKYRSVKPKPTQDLLLVLITNEPEKMQ